MLSWHGYLQLAVGNSERNGRRMKTYQVRTYVVDGETFDSDKAQLTDIIEFSLHTTPPGANVFVILKQWEVESENGIEIPDGGAVMK